MAISNKKSEKPLISYLTGDEMRIILSQPDSSTKGGFRDLVLLSVLYDTAARVDELINLKVKDVRLMNPAVITLHGKGRKVRQVPIMSNTKALLDSYMSSSMICSGMADTESYVFVNQKRQKLSRWGISYIINKYAELAKTQTAFTIRFPVTPHIFRQDNTDLRTIQVLMGHSDISTTSLYLHLSTKHISSVRSPLDGRGSDA